MTDFRRYLAEQYQTYSLYRDNTELQQFGHIFRVDSQDLPPYFVGVEDLSGFIDDLYLQLDVSARDDVCVHELLGKTSRMYFDIDGCDIDIEKIIEEILNAFNRVVGMHGLTTDRSEWSLFISQNEQEKGYHLISNVWGVTSIRQGHALLQAVRDVMSEDTRGYIDRGRFHTSASLRVVGCSKPGQRRVKWLNGQAAASLNEWIKQWDLARLSGSWTKSVELPLPAVSEQIELKDTQVQEIVDKVLEEYPNQYKFRRQAGAFVYFQREKPGYCQACERDHDSEGSYAWLNGSGMIRFCCRRGDPITLGTSHIKLKQSLDMLLQCVDDQPNQVLSLSTGARILQRHVIAFSDVVGI